MVANKTIRIQDFQNGSLLGWSLPSHVIVEARKQSDGLACLTEWTALPQEAQQHHFQTRQLVMDIFPALPVPSSRIITERLIDESYRGRFSNEDIEEHVVEHAKTNFTNYFVCLEQSDREGRRICPWEEDAVGSTVRPRMRAVLGTWLGMDASMEFKEKFFERHKLAVWGDRKVDVAERKVEKGVGRGSEMLWFGGKMMIAGSQESGGESVRRFL